MCSSAFWEMGTQGCGPRRSTAPASGWPTVDASGSGTPVGGGGAAGAGGGGGEAGGGGERGGGGEGGPVIAYTAVPDPTKAPLCVFQTFTSTGCGPIVLRGAGGANLGLTLVSNPPTNRSQPTVVVQMG